jgi:hypothetical protein
MPNKCRALSLNPGIAPSKKKTKPKTFQKSKVMRPLVNCSFIITTIIYYQKDESEAGVQLKW